MARTERSFSPRYNRSHRSSPLFPYLYHLPPFFLSFSCNALEMGRPTHTHARNGFVFLSYISPFYFAIKHFHIAFTWPMKVPSASQVGSRPFIPGGQKKKPRRRIESLNLTVTWIFLRAQTRKFFLKEIRDSVKYDRKINDDSSMHF